MVGAGAAFAGVLAKTDAVSAMARAVATRAVFFVLMPIQTIGRPGRLGPAA